MNCVIHNVTIFTNDDDNTIHRGHAVAVEGSRIAAVGPETELRQQYPHFRQIDGQGRLLMPGLVNTHMHFYSTLARGLALPDQPKDFAEILAKLWWRLDSSLDLDAVYYSALVPAITAAKKGVTAVIDHHASPNAVEGSLDRIEEALATVGLRGALCYEVSDRDGQESAARGLRENERYIRRCRSARAADPDHPFDGMVGLHASFTLDNDTLARAADLAASLERGCHIHVLEDGADRDQTREKYGAGVVKRLASHGILREKSIAAHCIHLTEAEKDLLAGSGAVVVHNPQSNMNNAVGRTDIFGLLDRGVTVGLGTDGMSADLRPDIRAAFLLHKHDLRDPNAGWGEIQQMVLKTNPAIYQRITGQRVGCIAPGYLADMILVDYFPPTPLEAGNFWGHFLFGIADAEVDTTIVNGEVVMEGKEVVGVDEAQIAEGARGVAMEVWERFANLARAGKRL